MTTHSKSIRLEWDGEWWTVSDEGGEFARATDPEQALNYARDLMYGPPTSFVGELRWLDLTGRIPVHGRTEKLRCACENPERYSYHGRDGELHCNQCDGLVVA